MSGVTALARLLPDFGPARDHPAFRRLLAGGLLSGLGCLAIAALIGWLCPAFARYRATAG